jgi:hypothetical protein
MRKIPVLPELAGRGIRYLNRGEFENWEINTIALKAAGYDGCKNNLSVRGDANAALFDSGRRVHYFAILLAKRVPANRLHCRSR